MATVDLPPTKEPAEAVIKKAIAAALQPKDLAIDALLKKVKTTTGHGVSRIKKYLSEMVGAEEVEEKRRKPPVIKKTTYSLTEKGRKRWL